MSVKDIVYVCCSNSHQDYQFKIVSLKQELYRTVLCLGLSGIPSESSA